MRKQTSKEQGRSALVANQDQGKNMSKKTTTAASEQQNSVMPEHPLALILPGKPPGSLQATGPKRFLTMSLNDLNAELDRCVQALTFSEGVPSDLDPTLLTVIPASAKTKLIRYQLIRHATDCAAPGSVGFVAYVERVNSALDGIEDALRQVTGLVVSCALPPPREEPLGKRATRNNCREWLSSSLAAATECADMADYLHNLVGGEDSEV
jgi:hypothetical protein